MFLLYKCGKCRQSFVALLFMLFCSASLAGIEIIDEGKAFRTEYLSEPWRLFYSLSSSVICKDIRDSYNEDSVTYYDKYNVVISKVLMVDVTNVIENTSLFSIDTDCPVFFVYLESVGAPSLWGPMSPLLVFSRKREESDKIIKIEIRNSNKEIEVLPMSCVVVRTREESFIYDKVNGLGTMSYYRVGESRCSREQKKYGDKRGVVYDRVYKLCSTCRGGGLIDVRRPFSCSCKLVDMIKTKLSFSFRVLDSVGE
ncbi:MAG: hypothetical protein QS721_08015 [Candidatus Endonucleobacter sp. (ex Gigantidas childressi)]|nr:hypothetical protein [Candidatus Endonucleobacter sp. (ex Gigantidas childressi)]